MARASSGVTPVWALAAAKRKAGIKAIPPTNPLRVIVFMIHVLPYLIAVFAMIDRAVLARSSCAFQPVNSRREERTST
jgi:hypothetical protein